MLEKQDTISKSHLATGRAVDQLRRQLGIILQEDSGKLVGACPVEGLTPAMLLYLRSLPNCHLQLLLTGARMRSLNIDTKARTVVLNAEKLSLPDLQALVDPLMKAPIPGDIKILPTTPSQEVFMTLVKYASLLPGILVVESDALPEDWLQVTASDVAAYWADPPLDIVPLAEAALPTQGAEHATLTCFRTRYGTSMHLALVVGDIAANQAPLARVHSSCITGDILGSLRCDCGDQLQMALDQIAQEGSGVLVYLHQEGRGIGIANKLRAYALQELGVDTYEANLMLGFDEDERDFAIAAGILKKLGVTRCRLLTNNPQKMQDLEQHGIKVSERVKLAVLPGQHNHNYLSAKALKFGHLI